MKVIKVKSLLPIRLDKYLMEQFPALNIGKLNKALRENKIKLNGKKQPLSTRVCAGDEIKLFILDEQLEPTPQKVEGPAFLNASFPAEVIYEDDFVLIANKPAGVAVMDEKTPDTLINRVLLYLYQKRTWTPGESETPALCHRLDTGTAGLVIVAKTSKAEAFLVQLIRERIIKKRYVCVTFGHPQPAKNILKGYLWKDAQKGKVVVCNKPGADRKAIETHYETMHKSGRFALLKVDLITGRTHQIRAHLASIGCPILGDSKYGNNAINRELKFKYQALCAYELSFPILDYPELQGLSGKTIRAEKPWWYNQMLQHQLK